MNIGIIGSRKRTGRDDVIGLINALSDFIDDDITLVSGGCKKGGDAFAEFIAESSGIPIIIHNPDEEEYYRLVADGVPKRVAYSRVAYARNGLIARDSDILIALVSPDRKGGTEDTIKKFLKKLTLSEKDAILNKRLIII
jgi:hypothetical protein